METTEITPQSNFNNQSANVNRFLDGTDFKGVWKHQVDAVKAIREHFEKNPQPKTALCVLPTGGGKTGIAVLAPYALNKSRVLVITPSVKISEQIHHAFVGNEAIDKPSFLVKQGCVTKENFRKYIPWCAGLLQATNFNTCFSSHLIISNAHKFGTKSRIQIDTIPKDVDLVIVDEAHHYPSKTWKLIVDHFDKSIKLFVTATPKYKNKDILENQKDYTCFEISRARLAEQGIIRNLIFPEDYESDSQPEYNKNDDAETNKLKYEKAVIDAFVKISKKVQELVILHDSKNPDHFHQAMILCQTIETRNPSDSFVKAYNQSVNNDREMCHAYTGKTSKQTLDRFLKKKFRTLIIVGRLTEGFDHPNVSVVGIARNVQSRILFAQFVGRALRKLDSNDTVDACIVSDKIFEQRKMWENFETLPDDDEVDEESDE